MDYRCPKLAWVEMLVLIEYNYRHRSLNWGLSNLDLFDNSEMPGGAWLGWEGFLNGNSKPLVPG